MVVISQIEWAAVTQLLSLVTMQIISGPVVTKNLR